MKDTSGTAAHRTGAQGFLEYEAERLEQAFADFSDASQEWRRLFSELLGTFFLVLVAAGGAMMGQAFPQTISRTAAVVAPGLMVLAVILFMGKVSGAHLNPVVTVAFSLRGDFPWCRAPGYIVVQLAGAALAAWFLQAVVHVSSSYGSNYPASGFSAGNALLMESVLTFGLVSVMLGTASGAQNLGMFGAFGVAAYIALAGLWGSPISGASMNPARTFGPDVIIANLHVLAFDHHHHPCAHCSSQRTGTSIRTTVTTGVVVAVISTFVPLSELAELAPCSRSSWWPSASWCCGASTRTLNGCSAAPVSPLSRYWQC